MIYDPLDFFIIQSICQSRKNISTWEITKKYFKDINSSKQDRIRKLNYKHQLVKQRLQKMKNAGFLFINKNGGGLLEYCLIKEKVKFCKHKFPDGYHKAILIFEDKKWMAFQI